MGHCYCGIDSGSWNTKAVLIDGDAKVLSTAVVRSGADLPGAATEALTVALQRAGMEREAVRAAWSTGFGRRNVPFADDRRTELDCHARGVRHYVDGPVTIVDIGGQDAKVIRLDESGRRISHRMNRKCAAGTGSFLEEIALRLDVDIARLPALAAGFAAELELGSFCTVFTGTELLAEIRKGRRPADLARAAYRSLARRVVEMEVLDGRVVATGGVVAFHPMVVEMLEALSSCAVEIPPHPQEMGAFGAAMAAKQAAEGRRSMGVPDVRRPS
jgi:predicted CoA-substrate-specific enzyme activase